MSRHLPVVLVALLCSFLAGCLASSQPVLEPDRASARDDQLLRQISDQQRWTRDAVQSRAERDELDAARDDDAEAVADLRKRFRKQTAAIERTTWIREAVALELEEGADDEASLTTDFEQAAHDRQEVIESADEIAQALAASKVARALSLSELRTAMLSMHRAQEAEQRLARLIGRAADAQPLPGIPAPDAGKLPAKAAPSALARLQTVTLPVPPPFVGAAAKLIELHPDEGKGLANFGPKLSAEATQIRAQLADLDNRPPDAAPAQPSAPAPPPASAEPPPPADGAAQLPPPPPAADAPAFTMAGDARKLVQRRGLPGKILTRTDGLLALRYEEQRPCSTGRCPTLVDYLFDAQGKFVRDQLVVDKRP